MDFLAWCPGSARPPLSQDWRFWVERPRKAGLAKHSSNAYKAAGGPGRVLEACCSWGPGPPEKAQETSLESAARGPDTIVLTHFQARSFDIVPGRISGTLAKFRV